MGVFSHCQISLDLDPTQVPFKEKQLLRKQVTSNGGVISYILTKKTSYLVCSNGTKTADSYKGRTAQKQGVPIVGIAFIQKCLDAGKLLDTDEFLLVGKTANMEFSSGKIQTSKARQEPAKQIKISSFNINKIKTWDWGCKESPSYPEDKYEVVKSVLFQKVDFRSKEELFYQLELHVVPEEELESLRNSSLDGGSIEYGFRVFSHEGVLQESTSEDSGTRQVRYCQTSEEAVEIYSYLYNQHKTMTISKKPLSRWIGSPRHRQNQLSIHDLPDSQMDQEVGALVSDLWKETLGELNEILAVDIKTLTAEKVAKAESILLQIKKALTSKDTSSEEKSSIEELSQEFYLQIPHKVSHKTDINTKSFIAKKQDLCQLIKDAVSVSETTNWSVRSSVQSKYGALRCHVVCLPSNHPHYKDVKNLITATQGETSVKIHQIFAVTRPLELTSFDGKLHNSRLLFHASRPANFVGILSRGLILPKFVVDDFGGERTDAGMLGSGIYFADNFSTSAKYSHISHSRGTRLMAVNQVALGECYETTSYKKDLTEAPEGFHSVHGLRNDGTNHSDFKDDEYAVYTTKQQCIKYLVEFSLEQDKSELCSPPAINNEGAILDDQEDDAEGGEFNSIDLSDVQSIEDPLAKVQPGLLSTTDQPIPLKAVHVRAKLLDLAAQVVVLQVYANDSELPIEAKYVFPLDENAAVCGFEAFINDKHIVGEVKEKETAHKEYKEAISKGHGAYLMDEEKPDVFTVSVGNLPAKTTVVIKITYVVELAVDGDKILFALPGSVAPWMKDKALAEETQSQVTTVKVESTKDRTLSVSIGVDMPYDIRTLESPTHAIIYKRTATKATVNLARECRCIKDGFQLLIGLAEIHVPRMWVEKHPDDPDSQACMLTFYPEFEAKAAPSEVVLLLDLSNSMRDGSSLTEAKKICLLALHQLPKGWTFNIVVFGTDFRELFPQSKVKTGDTLQAAVDFLQGLPASMGNTDVWRPLRAYFMLRSKMMRNIFLVSDGHVSNEDVTMETIRKNCRHTRVFTFGISATANKYLLRAMSIAGAGAFEFFDSNTKSKWEGKVKSQLSKASQPVLSSVTVDWCQFDQYAPAPIQAPNQITSLFSGSRQVVYGYVPYCTQATLRAVIDGKEVSTMVSTHELSITQGKILHQLTARNIIRDWEEGSLATDRIQHEAKKTKTRSYIINLSKKYSIVTQFTSFVAVEVRDESDKMPSKKGVDVNKLLVEEVVDSLPYLEWQGDVSQDALQPEVVIEERDLFEGLTSSSSSSSSSSDGESCDSSFEYYDECCLFDVAADNVYGDVEEELDHIAIDMIKEDSSTSALPQRALENAAFLCSGESEGGDGYSSDLEEECEEEEERQPVFNLKKKKKVMCMNMHERIYTSSRKVDQDGDIAIGLSKSYEKMYGHLPRALPKAKPGPASMERLGAPPLGPPDAPATAQSAPLHSSLLSIAPVSKHLPLPSSLSPSRARASRALVPRLPPPALPPPISSTAHVPPPPPPLLSKLPLPQPPPAPMSTPPALPPPLPCNALGPPPRFLSNLASAPQPPPAPMSTPPAPPPPLPSSALQAPRPPQSQSKLASSPQPPPAPVTYGLIPGGRGGSFHQASKSTIKHSFKPVSMKANLAFGGSADEPQADLGGRFGQSSRPSTDEAMFGGGDYQPKAGVKRLVAVGYDKSWSNLAFGASAEPQDAMKLSGRGNLRAKGVFGGRAQPLQRPQLEAVQAVQQVQSLTGTLFSSAPSAFPSLPFSSLPPPPIPPQSQNTSDFSCSAATEAIDDLDESLPPVSSTQEAPVDFLPEDTLLPSPQASMPHRPPRRAANAIRSEETSLGKFPCRRLRLQKPSDSLGSVRSLQDLSQQSAREPDLKVAKEHKAPPAAYSQQQKKEKKQIRQPFSIPMVPPDILAEEDDDLSRVKSSFAAYEKLQAVLQDGDLHSIHSVFRHYDGASIAPPLLDNFLMFQNEVGFWNLKTYVFYLSGLRVKFIRQVLKAAGLYSLGVEVATKIECIIATFLIIFYIQDMIEDLSHFKEIEETMMVAIKKAEDWLKCAEEEEQLSIVRRLQLGSSWEKLCRIIFTKMRDTAVIS